MDNFLPSAGTYKMSVQVNGMSLDECSFVDINDKIYLYFEESISNDPDVTALVVFLRNSTGEIAGKKLRYSIDDSVDEDETLVPVKNLDELPFFPIPENLPIGRYTMVSQVMSGNDVLQKNEKIFYYLNNTVFSYEGINVYLPGITENPQIIPKGTVLMLEAELDFGSRLDPYIVWYNGRRKISEGKYSDGAGQLFWKAPEQSGFFSIRAEVFPISGYIGLAGYQKEISLLVSSKTTDVHLVSENISQLVHWYVFDGNLNDSKIAATPERSLKSANNNHRWKSANGTYGLAAGSDNTYTLPKVSISNEAANWQALFRFMPLNEGQIFSVMFETYPDVYVNLYMENKNLVLKLTSPLKTVSQVVRLPEHTSFITAGVSFSILPDILSAKINIIDNFVDQGELAVQPISIEVGIKDNFQILLGTNNSTVEAVNPAYTAIWDEFALYNEPPMEIIAAEVNKSTGNERSEFDASSN
jgi:hypothetical protein